MNRLILRSLAGLLCVIFLSLITFAGARGEGKGTSHETTSVSIAHDTVRVRNVRIIAPAQTPEARPGIADMLINVPGDWARSFSVATDSRSLPYLGGIGAMTGVLMATDGITNGFSKRISGCSETVRSTSRQFVYLGDGRTHLGIAAAFALYGFVENDSRSLVTASQTVEALLACGISVQVLKHITGRESPGAATTSRGVWHFFPNPGTYQRHQAKYYAFPSGHIATTMATLTVIAENYPEASWIRPLGYSLMGCVGLSLMNVGYHWTSDFPLGIAMGYVFGMVAAHRQDHLFAFLGNDPYSGLRILPAISQEGTGVTLALLF